MLHYDGHYADLRKNMSANFKDAFAYITRL